MDVIVPFSPERPKSRLSDVLSVDERAAFARTMLSDVLDAVVAAGGDPRILATEAVDAGVPVVVDERALTTAVNDALDGRLDGLPAGGDAAVDGERVDGETADSGSVDVENADDGSVAVVMADLALATPAALRRLFAVDADVAIAPGRGGGTNALVVRHPDFRVDYHGASYLDHRRIAADVGASVRAVDSHRLATDVDEVADLAELLIHGEGPAKTWLREAGFALDASNGRVGVVRE